MQPITPCIILIRVHSRGAPRRVGDPSRILCTCVPGPLQLRASHLLLLLLTSMAPAERRPGLDFYNLSVIFLPVIVAFYFFLFAFLWLAQSLGMTLARRRRIFTMRTYGGFVELLDDDMHVREAGHFL